MNELKKHKRSDTVKWVVVFVLILALVAGMLALFTSGFRNWNPSTWFGGGETNEFKLTDDCFVEISGADNPTGVEGYLISLQKPLGSKYAGVSGFEIYKSKASGLTEITIPSEYNGKPVIGIDENCFVNCFELKSVTIPDSVVIIGPAAFANCKSLENITLPEKLEYIGESVFADSGIKTIEIPASVTEIDNRVFAGTSLESIVIPDTVKTLGFGVFGNCYKLRNITLPSELTTIGSSMFYKCISLETIEIPATVTEIKAQAFSECVSLNSITLPDKLERIETMAFLYCYSLKTITIPASVTYVGGMQQSVGNAPFDFCYNLKITNNSSVSVGVRYYDDTGNVVTAGE